jgi:HK97 family phage major capsid protein
MSEETKEKKTPEIEVDAEGIARLEGSVSKATEYMKSIDDKYDKVAKAQEEASAKLAKAQEHVDKRITELKDFLSVEHGKSGEQDIQALTGKWIKGAAFAARGEPIPDDCKSPDIDWEPDPNVEERAKVQLQAAQMLPDRIKTTLTTTTDATAGYLVPDILLGEIQVGYEIYGPLLARCRRVPVPAGVTVKVNSRTTNPTPYWRNAQGNPLDSETNPIYGQGTATPILCGAYTTVANELWELPGTGFQTDLLGSLVEAITKKKEQGVVYGDDDGAGDDTDPPSDGFTTSTASASDQDNLTAATLPVFTNFIAQSVADYSKLTQGAGTYILMHPVKKWAYAAASVGTGAANQIAWGDGISGPPPTIQGFQIIESEAMINASSVYWASLCRPQEDIFLCDSGGMSISYNPWDANQFTANETMVRVMSYADWVFPMAAHISIADFD